MSQLDAMAELDAQLHDALLSGGLADKGTYRAADPVDREATQAIEGVRVFIDRNVETIGDLRQFVAGRVEVAYLRQDVVPQEKGRITVQSTAYGEETFVNVKPISDDGSLSRWLVRRG